jgi:hypothetical protein
MEEGGRSTAQQGPTSTAVVLCEIEGETRALE